MMLHKTKFYGSLKHCLYTNFAFSNKNEQIVKRFNMQTVGKNWICLMLIFIIGNGFSAILKEIAHLAMRMFA